MTGTAPQRLRDLAQAASEDHPGPWHIVMDELQDAQGEVVMTPYDGADPSGWRLIAAVASPDRVLLLAELLEAIPAWELSAAQGDPWQIIADILSARDRFVASLTTEERA